MSLLTQIAGRYRIVENQFYVTGAAWQQVTTANPARYSLGFSTQNNNIAFLSTTQADVNAGLLIIQGNSPLWLTVKDHGPFAQAAWFWADLVGLQALTVFEVIDTEG